MVSLSLASIVVVSNGSFHAFHVVFLPLEYIPSIPPHFTYVVVNGLCLFKIKTAKYKRREIQSEYTPVDEKQHEM